MIGAMCCKTNRELIGCMEAHGVKLEVIIKYVKAIEILLVKILQNDHHAACIFLEECRDYFRLNQLVNNSFRDNYEMDKFWDNLKNATNPKAKSVMVNYVEMKKKFKIILRYPSVRMKAVADWTGILEPDEIFIKTKVLKFSPLENHTDFDWTCTRCQTKNEASNKRACVNCTAGRLCYPNDHLVYEGDVGLLKNPCLHPSSYIRAKAVYNKVLDGLFPNAEVFLFCGRADAEFCLVNKLSGGDLDGDDFLVITQQDLLPMENFDKCPELVYDEQPPQRVTDVPTNMDCVNFFVNFQEEDKVAIISQYHEAWSNLEGGILNSQCLKLARLHSIAIDFAKNGSKVDLDKDHKSLTQVKFPDYMGYPNNMSTEYKDSYKAKLSAAVDIPEELKRNRAWSDMNFGRSRGHRRSRNRRAQYFRIFCEICEWDYKNLDLFNDHLDERKHRERLEIKQSSRDIYALQKRDSEAKLRRKIYQDYTYPKTRREKCHSENCNLNRHNTEKGVKSSADVSRLKGGEKGSSSNKENDIWCADLSFQYFDEQKWQYCEDYDLLAYLNRAWQDYINNRCSVDGLVVEHEEYLYNLKDKRRYGKNGCVPLRWGYSEVLENTFSAEYLEMVTRTTSNPMLLREKQNSVCGFISAGEVQTVAHQRKYDHPAEDLQRFYREPSQRSSATGQKYRYHKKRAYPESSDILHEPGYRSSRERDVKNYPRYYRSSPQQEQYRQPRPISPPPLYKWSPSSTQSSYIRGSRGDRRYHMPCADFEQHCRQELPYRCNRDSQIVYSRDDPAQPYSTSSYQRRPQQNQYDEFWRPHASSPSRESIYHNRMALEQPETYHQIPENLSDRFHRSQQPSNSKSYFYNEQIEWLPAERNVGHSRW